MWANPLCSVFEEPSVGTGLCEVMEASTRFGYVASTKSEAGIPCFGYVAAENELDYI